MLPILIVGGIIVLLGLMFGNKDQGSYVWIPVLYLILLLSYVGQSSLLNYGGQFKIFLRDASIWVAIFFSLVVTYGYRDKFVEFKEVFIAQIFPNDPITAANGEVSVRKSQDGHFHVDAYVNGKKIPFLIDTGATDIVLSMQDAKDIGLDMKSLAFIQRSSTANGIVRGAPVTLNFIEIDSIRYENIKATVNEGELDESLLGMAFLSRLKSYKVEYDSFIMTP